MSSDARLHLDHNWYPGYSTLSGVNISLISKAYQLFGSTIDLLAFTHNRFMSNETLQMKLEDDGIISALSSVFQF